MKKKQNVLNFLYVLTHTNQSEPFFPCILSQDIDILVFILYLILGYRYFVFICILS